MCSSGWKLPLQVGNNYEVMKFVTDVQHYLVSITLPNAHISEGKLDLLDVCCKSVEVTNGKRMVPSNANLKSLLTYKKTQYRFALFFSKIISMGKFSDSNSTRQFISAYKKGFKRSGNKRSNFETTCLWSIYRFLLSRVPLYIIPT